MQTQIVLYIILSGIIALLVALFQYVYKAKHPSKLNIVFTILRFVSLFALLLLLINPKFDKTQVFTEKPTLVIAVDNSNSIAHLKQDKVALNLAASLQSNAALKDKFNIETVAFDAAVTSLDTLTFKAKETNIDQTLTEISEVYNAQIAPIVLITDGNQSYGNDYAVPNQAYTQPVYPIILGDTITYTDLSIRQLNVNRYAFLKNKFPVEAILVYQGHEPVASEFTIYQGNKRVFSKRVAFSKTKNTHTINASLPASQIGVTTYRATLKPLKGEKNTINNSKNFAIEVIDQKTKIAIVSSFVHPDLGALKKSIESNEQRSVSILKPSALINRIEDYQLLIMYQPNYTFKALYETVAKFKKNTFTIVGPKTDLRFLNTYSTLFSHDVTQETEDYQAKLNLNFSPFLVDPINFESFPPLKSAYGDVKFKAPFETILDKTVLGISKNESLLATLEIKGTRAAILFGEGIWQWRAQSFINENTFASFDDFIGKLIQYLASSKKRSRLNVAYKSFYTGTSNLKLTAQVFDKNYQFDARASLELQLTDINTKAEQIIPFVLKNRNYQVDLSGLSPSKYNFTVRSKIQNISKSGTFEVLAYNVEQQFLNADVSRLEQLAAHTEGQSFFPTDEKALVDVLVAHKNYKALQKSIKNTIPLIDWTYLLYILVFTLALEWFLRKYNGLI